MPFLPPNQQRQSTEGTKTESVSLRKCPYDHWLTNKAYLSAITVRETFIRVLPTRWRQKSTDIDTEQNYVTVLCIHVHCGLVSGRACAMSVDVRSLLCWMSAFFSTHKLYSACVSCVLRPRHTGRHQRLTRLRLSDITGRQCPEYTALFHHEMVAKNRIERGLN